MRLMDIPYERRREGIVIHVKVQPRSSKKGIEIMEGRLKVWLSSPPVENKANEELIEVISKELGIKKTMISIIKGLTSREKVLLIKESS
jgi:uncharacterized protein (TIGR00251 family)